MASIIPVILCGGEGRRLWPLSTPEMPKPFHSFGRERSLFGEALLRCRSPLLDQRPIIVAAQRHATLVSAELEAAEVAADLVFEPMGRNTCAAALAGAMQALARQPDALILVLASDHLIEPVSAFHDGVQDANTCAALDYIVTFGVQPSHPSSEFGYVVPGETIAGSGCRVVKQFKEKPGFAEARSLMAGGALWNSGNFLVKASLLTKTAEALAPANWRAVSRAFADAERKDGHVVLEPTALANAVNVAVDVALLEKAKAVAVLPVSFHWRDLGTWASVEAMTGASPQ